MKIRKDTIEFVNQAKESFEKKENRIVATTYLDEIKGYIALRWGFSETSIEVYELGKEIGLFEDWINKPSDEEYIDQYIKEIENKDYSLTDEQLNRLQNLIYKIRPPKHA